MRATSGVGLRARCASAVALSAALVLVSGVRAAPDTSRLDFSLRLDNDPAPLLARKRVGTLPQAIRAFGRPAKLVRGPGAAPACRATWPALALAIEFSTADVASCVPASLSSWATVTATGRRWQSTAGLHVGHPVSRLRILYPAARRLDFLGRGSIWELETGGPLCDGGRPLALGACVRRGHVDALVVLHVPACG
jgi:hypothetical protein